MTNPAAHRDPRSFIDAQTQGVQDILSTMISTVLAAGGHLHRGITFVEREGNMAVTCDAGADDGPLLVIPRELLVPVEDATWSATSTGLQLLQAPPGISAQQRDLLDMHIDLYNACDKLATTAATHPKLTVPPALVEQIRRLRPRFDSSNDPTAVFLATRVFALRPPEDPDAPGVLTLMPLVDLLNHDPRAGSLRVDGTAMTITVHKPLGGVECFVNYGGPRDTLDQALEYAYLDTTSDLVRCPRVDVEIPGMGTVQIEGRKTRGSGRKPPTIRATEDGLSVASVILRPGRQQPWRVHLQMAVQARCIRNGVPDAQAQRIAAEAPDLLWQAATDCLADLADAATAQTPHSVGTDLVAKAATSQVEWLRQKASA